MLNVACFHVSCTVDHRRLRRGARAPRSVTNGVYSRDQYACCVYLSKCTVCVFVCACTACKEGK